MKKLILTMAVAMASTFAFAAEPVTPEAKPLETVRAAKPPREHKPMTPEQFAEFKTKHLNMLSNRAKILEGETTCANSAKNMQDMKVCFKTAMEARKELGMHRHHPQKQPRHLNKGVEGENKQHDKVKASEPVVESK